jgi:hypothetical protein
MVSDSHDVCVWCKRPFDSNIFARPAAEAPVRKAPPAYINYVKGGALVAATIVAILSLAHIKTAPDAAIVQNASGTVATNASGVSATKPSDSSSSTSNVHVGSTGSTSGAESSSVQASNPYNGQPAASGNSGGSGMPGQDAAKLGEVQLSFDTKGEQETAFGKVLIINESNAPITDFRLTLRVNGVDNPLVPFEGNMNYPVPLSSKRIPPHGRLAVAVMTPGHYVVGGNSAKSVLLEASLEGTSTVLNDESAVR